MHIIYSIVFVLCITSLIADPQIPLTKQQQEPSNTQETLTISENLDNGSTLILSDGTAWRIAPQDTSIASTWLLPHPIKIEQNQNPNYPWTLKNQDTNEEVHAKKLTH